MNKILHVNSLIIVLTLIMCACQSKDESLKLPAGEGFLNVTGGKIWYKVVGADKAGIPLLVVHGGPGAPHDYLSNLEILANERPVIFYDQLGCGNSDRPSDISLWTVARFTDELEQLRIALNLNEIHLLGQSWGGYLTTNYISRYGSVQIKSLTLSAPLLNSVRWANDQRIWISQLPQNVQDTINKYEASGDFSSASYQEAVMIFYQKHVCRLNPWPEALNLTFQKMGLEVYNHMWGPSEFTLTGCLQSADLTPVLSTIGIPCLLTCGEFDEARPETMQSFKELIPNARLKIFEGASHSHHLENQEEYLQTLRSFLIDSE